MSALVLAIVLAAAAAHAGWNALLKSGADRFWTMTALSAVTGLCSAALLLFVPSPAAASWPYIVSSAVLHLGYNALLVRLYGSGDFVATYPIARGSSPLLIALGAALFAGEFLTPSKVAGVTLVSLGILALGLDGARAHPGRIPVALITGASIAIYSLIDGLGARLSGAALGYSAWMFVLWALMSVGTFIARRGVRSLSQPRDTVLAAIGGGIIAGGGYTAVIWAMSVTPMGLVSALRETSVVFAALLGRIVLKERLSPTRLCACCVIAGGGALLA